MRKEDILVSIKNCLSKLISRDNYLLNDFDYVKEETLNHRLAFYLEQESCFSSYNVDIEYIAAGLSINGQKKIVSGSHAERCVRPDIIIHKRGNHISNNLVVFEAKKRYLNKSDKDKLEKLTTGRSNTNKYIFGIGLSYQPNQSNKYFLISIYQNGRLIDDKIKVKYQDLKK